jgi:hypothetical protein
VLFFDTIVYEGAMTVEGQRIRRFGGFSLWTTLLLLYNLINGGSRAGPPGVSEEADEYDYDKGDGREGQWFDDDDYDRPELLGAPIPDLLVLYPHGLLLFPLHAPAQKVRALRLR